MKHPILSIKGLRKEAKLSSLQKQTPEGLYKIQSPPQMQYFFKMCVSLLINYCKETEQRDIIQVCVPSFSEQYNPVLPFLILSIIYVMGFTNC